MKLRGRTVVLFGDFREIERRSAIRRLQALGALVAHEVTEETDLIFLGPGERGPIPRTDVMLRTPYLNEDALIGMLEREEGVAPEGVASGFFLAASEVAGARDSGELYALLDGADWAAVAPERDGLVLRDRLVELERDEGVTDAHRLATRKLIEAGVAELQQPYGHDTEIVAHAISPDGRYLATGSWVGDDYDAGGVLQIWEVASGRCVNAVRYVAGGVGWPGYRHAIQWSADSSRIAMAHRTNMVGVWSFEGELLATVDVSDGNSRPSEYALSPDGRSVYFHCGTNGDGGLQGCVVPVDRGRLSWLPNHVESDHPYLMARQLPERVREDFAERDQGDEEWKVGQWIDEPVWSPDGSRLYGSNAICVDAESREVVWYAPGKFARLSPDGKLVAAVSRRGLFLREADSGRIRCGPYALGKPVALFWAPGRAVNRLAVLTPPTGTAETGGVHVFDDDRLVFSAEVPHSGWEEREGDHNAWAWAPGGERAAFLTIVGVVEVWSFEDSARPELVQSVPAGGADAVYWGADDTLVLLDDVVMQFVKVETGEVVGDFYSLYVPPGPRPVEGELVELLAGRTFALDEDDWAMILQPDAVIAPEGSEDELDDLLAWGIGARHAWPVRWGELRVLPDALTAADVLDSEDGELLRAYREELEEMEEADGESVEWPPENTASVDELFEVARRSLVDLDPYSWGYHIGEYLRAAARLRARYGEAEAAMTLVGDIPEAAERLAAASDVATILARAGDLRSAGAAFSLAQSLFPSVDQKMFQADRSASFGAAFQALGHAGDAEQWFRHARTSITVEPNPWEDHIAVMHSLLECGRDDLVRVLLNDRAAHPVGSFFSEAEWLVYLLRTGRLDLARAFQGLPGWDVPYEVLTVLAELGRSDLLETWGDHNWAVDDELVELAQQGIPPSRPPTPSDQDVHDLAKRYAEIQGISHAQREHPIKELIESAARCGHISAVLDLLELLPDRGDFNDRPSSSFGAIWLLYTGFNRPPF
ncbi:PD40 domain-containing protein [Actinomadura barringtoniae]|uniref:PD40 domain-containing protein n=1 Tax=Actinomadura barringtoniae TaxID=1427535 RepID=A0A939TFH5_9ACTN|nr:PD40 domain-containing protein [Actinomadura barringtoniae]MBO2454375.1 PD40 domain-containing protein [Actinomadura barringtoniae]